MAIQAAKLYFECFNIWRLLVFVGDKYDMERRMGYPIYIWIVVVEEHCENGCKQPIVIQVKWILFFVLIPIERGLKKT